MRIPGIYKAIPEFGREIERLTDAYHRYYTVLIDIYKAEAESYRLTLNIINAYSHMTDTLSSLIRNIGEGVNSIGRMTDAFMSFSKAVLTSSDAISATANILSTVSTVAQDTSQVFSTLQNTLENMAKVVSAPMEAIDRVISSFESFGRTISSISYAVTSLVDRLSSFSEGMFEIDKAISGVITTFTKFTAFLYAGLEIASSVLTGIFSVIQVQLQRIILPIQQLSVALTRVTVQFQMFILPLRIFLPIVQSLISLLGNLVGVYARAVLAANEVFNSLAQLQGMVISLSVYLSQSGETITTISTRLREWGITIQSVFETVKVSISAGLVPLTSLIDGISRLSRNLSVLMGLTPDETFRRLTQAIIEGNASLLQQIGIFMTEADLLNQVIARFGLLITNLRQVHPLIRIGIMREIVTEEERGIEVPRGRVPLMVIVSELRAILQNFQAMIGEVLRTYVGPESPLRELRRSLRSLFDPTVASTIANAISQVLQTLVDTLRPIADALRNFIVSTGFQNIVLMLRGMILSLGFAVEAVIEKLREWTERLRPEQLTEMIATWGAKVAAFIVTVFESIPPLFSSIVSYLTGVFSYFFTNLDKIVKIFALVAQILSNAVIQLQGFLSSIPQAMGLGTAGGAGLGALAALIGLFAGVSGIGIPVLLILGALAGGGLGAWYGLQRGGGTVPPEFQQLNDLIKEMLETIQDISQLPDFSHWWNQFSQQLQQTYQQTYQQMYARMMEALGVTTQQTEAAERLEVSYRKLVQAVEPVVEHFVKLHDILRDALPLLTTYLGRPQIGRVGETFVQIGTVYERGLSLLRAAMNELMAASQRFNVVLFAAATGVRGAQTDLLSALQQLISSLRRFYDAINQITEQVGRLVSALTTLTITSLRLQFVFGMIPAQTAPYALVTRMTYPIEVGGRRIGELLRLWNEYLQMLTEAGLQDTIEALAVQERFYSQILQHLSAIARMLETVGAMLLAGSELLKEQVVLFTSLFMETGRWEEALRGVQGVVLSLDQYFYSLGVRIGAAFMTGNIEEFQRIARQLIGDLRVFYMERLPQYASEMAETLLAPLNMWMKGIGELRSVLQQLGAEGLVFPLMLRNAIPELIRMINYFRIMRDEMLREGLIPAAAEFNNRLLQAQRLILEILGLGGMFLPAYTPEQVIRAREMMGMLPQQVILGIARGRLPMEVPGLRVVPPATLWQLLAFAPGLAGVFGPFITPGQMFGLLPTTGLFRGLWEGLGFLGMVTPEMIRMGRAWFIQRWRDIATFGMDIYPLLLWRAIMSGYYSPARGGGEIFPMELMVQNVEMGRIRARELYVQVMTVEMVRALRRGDWEGYSRVLREMEEGVRGILTAPTRTLPLVGFQRGTGGIPIMVGELGLPEIVHTPSLGRQVISGPTILFVPPTEPVSVTPTYSTYGLENWFIPFEGVTPRGREGIFGFAAGIPLLALLIPTLLIGGATYVMVRRTAKDVQSMSREVEEIYKSALFSSSREEIEKKVREKMGDKITGVYERHLGEIKPLRIDEYLNYLTELELKYGVTTYVDVRKRLVELTGNVLASRGYENVISAHKQLREYVEGLERSGITVEGLKNIVEALRRTPRYVFVEPEVERLVPPPPPLPQPIIVPRVEIVRVLTKEPIRVSPLPRPSYLPSEMVFGGFRWYYPTVYYPTAMRYYAPAPTMYYPTVPTLPIVSYFYPGAYRPWWARETEMPYRPVPYPTGYRGTTTYMTSYIPPYPTVGGVNIYVPWLWTTSFPRFAPQWAFGFQRGGRLEGIGGSVLRFEGEVVRVPVTFEISVDVRDSRSGDVIETLTREITTVVHLNPRLVGGQIR